MQSVFVRLWENRNDLTISGSMKSYLFTACRNAALGSIRSMKRQEQYAEGQDADDLVEHPQDMESESNQAILRQRLYEAIQQLKPKTRQIFTLHKMEGLTYQEISDHLGIPKRTVEYNIYSALNRLKELLYHDYEQYKST